MLRSCRRLAARPFSGGGAGGPPGRRAYHGTAGTGDGFPSAEPSPPPQRPPRPLYVPTTAVQRGVLAGVSAVTALLDPQRADMVAALGETTGVAALERLRARMRSHPVGSALLRDRPAITSASLDLGGLRALPSGTFGREYVSWMDEHGYSPDSRPPVSYIEDDELAFIMQRYRQTHDFTHVLLGPIPPTVLGEIIIKWFELAHFNFPMTFLSAVVGPAALPPRDMLRLYRTGSLSWASKVGQDAELLLNVRFEDMMDRTLEEVRLDVGLPPLGPPERVMAAIV
jgi:ubiquinone biosynthesis protein COQ4